MGPFAVFAPSAALFALVAALLVATGRARLAAVRAGQVKVADIDRGQRAWPDRAQRVANAYDNQFQLPVLFHALAPIAYLTRTADLAFLALAWAFVALRAWHAWLYATTNPLLLRFRVFLAGAAVLAALWILIVGRLVLRST